MLYRSGVVALIAAGAVAVSATLLVLITVSPPARVLAGVFFASLASAYAVGLAALRYLLEPAIAKIDAQVALPEDPSRDEDQPPLKSFAQMSARVGEFADTKQQEIERLRKLEAFRKDFVADVSHELKTPIFAAQGFIHTLLDGAVKDKSVRKKFLKKAARSLDGLDHLVQDLLTLSQIETGQIRMRFEDMDLYALTEEVFEQLRDKAGKKGIDLRIEGPARKIVVYADWLRISQVMTNLVSNAIQHSGESAEVVVSFSIRKKSVVTSVRDSGIGIPAEHINRIFERFYRVDKSRSREKGGTGLGLAIVKHILEGHGSRPEVESEPGKGSTFRFRLPRGKNGRYEQSGPDDSTKE